jgi:hypothetical protein
MKLVTRFSRLVSRLALLLVVGYALVYALGWVQLYRQPHPYRVASEWIFQNIPQGSILVGPHWDDRLPISIPGKDAPRTFVMEGRDAELPFYERDTKEKVSMVLRRMAKADYVIFPTARISDSIPRIPEEYPYTTAIIQLLWAEKLGFTLEKTFKDRPSFFGLSFNDDLADESFSVYDHPKVVIFKNVERLSEEQMTQRVMNPASYQPLPTMDEILLMDEGGWASTATVYDPNPKRLVRTFGFLLLVGASFWILVGPFLTFLPDRGLGMSFLGGIVLGGGLTWMCAALDILPFNASAGLLVVSLLMVCACIRFCSNRAVRRSLVGAFSVHGAFVLLSLFTGVVAVVVMKALFPSYFWGAGDFQQFALSFFARNETIPPTGGWNPLPESGSWYGGHLLAGWLVKLVGATGSFAYEVCFVMLGGAVGGVLYTAFSVLIRRPLSALLVTLICVVPAIRGAHVLYNGYSGVDVAQAQGDLKTIQDPLVEWLASSIQGAPLAVEACDLPAGKSVALRAGLPTHKEGPGSEVICNLKDPQAAFQAMMAQGVSLLIIPGKEGEVEPSGERRELLSKLTARPDLFAVLYSKDSSMVLTPAFSDYFPRAYNKPATIE